LSRLPRERRLAPEINVVLALFERDAGNEKPARGFLASVVQRFPRDAPLQRALAAPLGAWPRDLESMVADPVRPAGR